MPLETLPSTWCEHQLTPKTSGSQLDLHNPSGFGTMDGLAKSTVAMVLTVAFLEFVGNSHRPPLQPQCLHPALATRRRNELGSSFWPCPGALRVAPVTAASVLLEAQPLCTPTECILEVSRALLGESRKVSLLDLLADNLATLSLHIVGLLTEVDLALSTS